MNKSKYKEIVSLINKKYEGDYWDYKQAWHKDKERLIIDILCFANTVHNKDCYIIIGVSDKGEIIGLNEKSENRKKQADVLDMLSNLVFAGGYCPKVSVETIIVQEKEIDVITIYNSNNVPFYIDRKPNKSRLIVEGFIYSREGDRNTPVNKNSSVYQIELLWKKRLGLLNPPVEQIALRMSNKIEWQYSNNSYYYIFNPDFRLEEIENYEENRLYEREFYSYNQTNSSTSYSNLNIMFRGTILKEIQMVTLDGGRYVTPTPKWSFIEDSKYHIKPLYTYKYILKDSIEYKLQQFLFNEDNDEARYAKDKFDEVVLYFDNKEEKKKFENDIILNGDLVKKYISDECLNTYIIENNNELEVKDVKEKLIMAFALKRYLRDFRRREAGENIKRIKKVNLSTVIRNEGTECFKHEIIIDSLGIVKHIVYKNEKIIDNDSYEVECKYYARELLNSIEFITYKWKDEYVSKNKFNNEWLFELEYEDRSNRIIKGNLSYIQGLDEIKRRINYLVDYEIKPIIFDGYFEESIW